MQWQRRTLALLSSDQTHGEKKMRTRGRGELFLCLLVGRCCSSFLTLVVIVVVVSLDGLAGGDPERVRVEGVDPFEALRTAAEGARRWNIPRFSCSTQKKLKDIQKERNGKKIERNILKEDKGEK